MRELGRGEGISAAPEGGAALHAIKVLGRDGRIKPRRLGGPVQHRRRAEVPVTATCHVRRATSDVLTCYVRRAITCDVRRATCSTSDVRGGFGQPSPRVRRDSIQRRGVLLVPGFRGPLIRGVWQRDLRGFSARQGSFEGQWRAVRPLRMATAAEQRAERNIAPLKPQLSRAGVFGRDELGAASAAQLIVIGWKVLQRKNGIGHDAQCSAAPDRNTLATKCVVILTPDHGSAAGPWSSGRREKRQQTSRECRQGHRLTSAQSRLQSSRSARHAGAALPGPKGLFPRSNLPCSSRRPRTRSTPAATPAGIAPPIPALQRLTLDENSTMPLGGDRPGRSLQDDSGWT